MQMPRNEFAASMTLGPSQPPTPSSILYIDVLGSYRSTTL